MKTLWVTTSTNGFITTPIKDSRDAADFLLLLNRQGIKCIRWEVK